ncbi:MAG: hypothetical protein U0792_21085 [Gemmataceae bacterium]
MFRPFAGLVLGLVLVSLVGCAKPMHPVKGFVHFKDGAPLKAGRVVIDFEDGKTGAWGAIREDGTFEMGTLTPNDGVPPGTYKVYLTSTIEPPPASLGPGYVPKELIHKKFADKETSGIVFQVPQQTTWDIVVEKP